MRQIKKTNYYSYVLGKLPAGCRQCVLGQKLVLFITGICPRHCYFCPISDNKKDTDVCYANEVPIKLDDTYISQIIKEAYDMKALGCGITGGDPLSRLDRTCEVIVALKKEFGKNFHIHLYTSFDLCTIENLRKLNEAGLDEIRFHPCLDNSSNWSNLERALSDEFDFDVGIEVPLLVKKENELKEFLSYAAPLVKFINFNELEVSDNEFSDLTERGYKTVDEDTYAVKGSMELGKRMMRFLQKMSVNVHLCSARLKDDVQLRNRVLRRSKNIAAPFDKVDSEGMLQRCAIYVDGFDPSISNYDQELLKLRLSTVGPSFERKSRILNLLRDLKDELINDFNVPEKMLFIDDYKFRLLTSYEWGKKVKNYIDARTALVLEYPTYDSFQLELEWL